MRKIWPFTFNFLWFASIAFVVPYIVLYYQDLGFTGTQIGLLTGITPLITFFSAPFWTGIADKRSRHRLIMSIAMLIGVITIVVFPLLGGAPQKLDSFSLRNCDVTVIAAESRYMPMVLDNRLLNVFARRCSSTAFSPQGL